MKALLGKNVIYPVVAIISGLLVLNIVLTYFNNTAIRKNREVQYEVEKVRTYYDQIGKVVIHSLDLGLRGYALVREEQFVQPLVNSINWKDSIVLNVEEPLQRLGYDFTKFNVFKDSLDGYVRYCQHLKQLLDENRMQDFTAHFSTDKGGHLWWQYLLLEEDINTFADKIDREAQENYDLALYRNQILQVILFLVCVPTLIYTAYYTLRNFRLSELLRKSEEEKNDLLRKQNESLERLVTERTHEILAQNEEIHSQSEALAIQNEELIKAHKIIEIQNKEIKEINAQLNDEVMTRTQELREANKHLLEQNNQLEQFAFIAAHNLRAPLARILGLANLMQISKEDDRDLVLGKLMASTNDLDLVIRDLNTILNIRRQTENLVEVNLEDVIGRVKRTLEKEIESTHTVITHDFHEASRLIAVASYVESILYNLISNAVKYRDPERNPFIMVQTKLEDDYIVLSVTDNGLGIDLSRHQQHVFSLYKRFHLHMEGRGLGLYLVRTQVESMGGKVGVKSVPNQGTTFLIYFKRHQS